MTRTLANASASDRSSTDFYRTPDDVTKALLDHLELPPETVIWEPACGQGHMAQVIEQYGYEVQCSDLYPTPWMELQDTDCEPKDFLKSAMVGIDWIITNPPFSKAEEFIRHCAYLEPSGFALLLKSQFWHSSKRQKLFVEIRPAEVLPLCWRPDFLFGDKGGSPTMEVLWTVWRHPFKQDTTRYLPLSKPPKASTLWERS